MPNTNQDRAMVEEAKKIISDIVTHQKTSSNRMSQFESQVEEIKKAQVLLEESVYRGGTETLNDESGLNNFNILFTTVVTPSKWLGRKLSHKIFLYFFKFLTIG